MKKLICLFCIILCLFTKAQTPSLSITSSSGSSSITCGTPSLQFMCFCVGFSSTATFTWVNPSYIYTGNPATITSAGSYTVLIMSGNAMVSQVFTVGMNTTQPVSSISSTFQVLTGTMTPVPVTVTAISPTVNIHHEFYAPTGGTVIANSLTSVYQPGSVGNYTHCIIDDANGCSSCQTFTIQYGSPETVSLQEITENENSFSIYPNPTKDLVHIKISDSPGDVRASLFDSRGELIRESILVGSDDSINVNDLTNGIYILQLRGLASPVRCQRLIISR